jgi:hypothetical protein
LITQKELESCASGSRNSARIVGGRLVAGTKSGKVVGWQLQPTAYEEADPTAAPEELPEQSPAPPSAPPPKTDPPPPHGTSHGENNGFTKKSEFAAAAAKAAQERGGGRDTNPLDHGGRQNSRGRGLPPVNLVRHLETMFSSWLVAPSSILARNLMFIIAHYFIPLYS